MQAEASALSGEARPSIAVPAELSLLRRLCSPLSVLRRAMVSCHLGHLSLGAVPTCQRRQGRLRLNHCQAEAHRPSPGQTSCDVAERVTEATVLEDQALRSSFLRHTLVAWTTAACSGRSIQAPHNGHFKHHTARCRVHSDSQVLQITETLQSALVISNACSGMICYLNS